ncbi:hypothetical protein Pla52o_08130 [Novipirellula galeiformis]|uniref:Uncharacterized protein n=1 Tax=Novipirellula galeiformis TaxID=2528004 RepID=A0A5C6CTY7_9BACT|nr:hypothetical protein [Novipirellula galeiformis]TWU26957.1 hypothetical protein Pla52o_08130 [Novipirellula galeiformis]
MNLVSRIALIAYVVGGWLLPAMHHHHGHSHHSGASQAGCCAELECERPAAVSVADSRDGESKGCDHHHDGSSHADDHARSCSGGTSSNGSFADDTNAILFAVNSSHSHACLGLCALCSAQSLKGEAVAVVACSVDQGPVCGRVVSTGIHWPLSVQPGGISSRGPPAIL